MEKRAKRDFGVREVEELLNTVQTDYEALGNYTELLSKVLTWARDVMVQQQITSKKLRLKTKALITAAKERMTPEQLRILDEKVEANLSKKEE